MLTPSQNERREELRDLIENAPSRQYQPSRGDLDELAHLEEIADEKPAEIADEKPEV